jgi:NAD(P)-dependent dehydrogenase (short-subunit alcohol dehydrogenase family)
MSSAAAGRPTLASPIACTAAKAGIELLIREIAARAGPFGIRATTWPVWTRSAAFWRL